MKIILASKSPQRKEILKMLNINFKIIKSEFNEKNIKDINPIDFCMNSAIGKAIHVSSEYPQSYIIGADTVVCYNKKILGKPNNRSQAIEYLQLLNNSHHEVYTGVSIVNKDKSIKKKFYEKTIVTFNNVNQKDIKFYIDKYKPYDKAGSYGIQEWSSIFIKKINGCFYNVVGFPLPKFYKLFAEELHINK
jgi:septum formation protein